MEAYILGKIIHFTHHFPIGKKCLEGYIAFAVSNICPSNLPAVQVWLLLSWRFRNNQNAGLYT